MVVKLRTFRRIVDVGDFDNAVTIVDGEVNTFVASLPFDNVLDIIPHQGPVSKYDERAIYMVTVIYLE